MDEQGRSYGIPPEKYHWAMKIDGSPEKVEDWESIWPWEKAAMEQAGRTVYIGADPVKK